MAAIISDANAIGKNQRNESQGFRFRGIDDVYNALHPIFAAHGVVCVPFVESVTPTTFEYEVTKGQYKEIKRLHRTVVIMGYRFTAADGSFVEAKTVGEGLDHSDKGTAKALSVAHKYLLLQTFLIPTQDIEDGDRVDPTIDAREELRNAQEQRAERVVRESVAKNENPELPPDAAEKLERKRKSLEEKIASGQGVTANAPAVESATVTPLESQTAPSEAPGAENGPDTEWPDWVISTLDPKTGAAWMGQNLAEMKIEDLQTLCEKWAVKHWDRLQKNPAKFAEATKVKEAFEARKHELGK